MFPPRWAVSIVPRCRLYETLEMAHRSTWRIWTCLRTGHAGQAPTKSAGEQSLEERPVALKRHAQVLGGDFLAGAPLTFQPLSFVREGVDQGAHHLGHQRV